MLIIYRVLSILINIVSALIAFSLIMTLPVVFSSPLNMLSAFMIVCIVLYAWFSSRFRSNVLFHQRPVKASLRDWIRVNGIVSLIYSVMGMVASAVLLINSSLTAELVKTLPENINVQQGDMNKLFMVMLAFSLVLFAHILLTFWYMKKNKSFFQS